MGEKIDTIRSTIGSLREKVEQICRETCESRGLDFNKLFGGNECNDKESDNDGISADSENDDGNAETAVCDDGDAAEKDENCDNADESIGGILLYDKARCIFEAENGINEDGSDYGFDDYIRECSSPSDHVDEHDMPSAYHGGNMVVESLSIDDFNRRYAAWVNNGKKREDLALSSFDNADDREFKRMLMNILRTSGTDPIDRNGDGNVSQKEYKKYLDDHTDINGELSFGQQMAKGFRQAGAGINRYLNHFMPMSWIQGIERGVGKAVSRGFDKIGGNKVVGAYNALGGNKALALGTLGGLVFGPVGAAVGALAGKGLSKLIDYGNDKSK